MSRAHFYAGGRRPAFVRVPSEDRETGQCARLMKSVYGARDAAQCFDAFSERTMEKF